MLLFELDLPVCERGNADERIDPDAGFANRPAPRLERFLNRDTDADKRRTRPANDANESARRIAVSDEVVDQQHTVVLVQKILWKP